MIRDIPHFDLGYVADGAGHPVDDSAIAYCDAGGIERELRLEGEGAIDLMPIIVQAVNSYDEMTAALRAIDSALTGAGFGSPDDKLTRARMGDTPCDAWLAGRAALAKAEGRTDA